MLCKLCSRRHSWQPREDPPSPLPHRVQPLPFCLLSVFPAFFAAFAAAFLLMTGLLFSSIIADIRKTRTTQASFLLVLLQITLSVCNGRGDDAAKKNTPGRALNPNRTSCHCCRKAYLSVWSSSIASFPTSHDDANCCSRCRSGSKKIARKSREEVHQPA